MTMPKRIGLREAIISFKPQVLKEETVQSLFQSAFDFRSIGSCGLDSIPSDKKVSLGHTLIRILSHGIFQHNFFL